MHALVITQVIQLSLPSTQGNSDQSVNERGKSGALQRYMMSGKRGWEDRRGEGKGKGRRGQGRRGEGRGGKGSGGEEGGREGDCTG